MPLSQILQEVPLPFGKHKGRLLSDLATGTNDERGYVTWVATEFQNQQWREAAGAALQMAQVVPAVTYRLDLVTYTRVGLVCPYEQRVVTALRDRIDGINWNRSAERWEFPQTQLTQAVEYLHSVGRVELSASAKLALDAEINRRARLDHIRGMEDTHLEIPTLLPLFGFQRVGVEFVLAADSRALIADEMGLGKTPEAIGVYLTLKVLSKARRALVVCPASLKVNWYREWIRFAGLEPTVWSGPKHKGPLDAEIHVVNYDIFGRHRVALEKLGFDLVILDEAHYLKNRTSKRTIAVFGGYSVRTRTKTKPFRTPYAVLLTGTPVLNRPSELYPLLHYLAPDRFSDWFQYANRYGAWSPMNMEGRPWKPQHLQELHERTKDIVIRRKKADVLKDLPPKLISDFFVPLTTEQRRQYRTALGSLASQWKTAAKEKRKPNITELHALVALLNSFKLDKVSEIISELQNEDDVRSVLVFCTRLAPLQELRTRYGSRAIYIDGSMSPDARQAEVDRFQRGEATIALLSFRAAREGLTLTKADTVVFIDQDFVPANHEQAEDRAHRIGQVNPVQVYYLLVEDSIDEDLRALLAEKLAVTSQIADGQIRVLERQQSVFGDFVRRLKMRYKQFSSIEDQND